MCTCKLPDTYPNKGLLMADSTTVSGWNFLFIRKGKLKNLKATTDLT